MHLCSVSSLRASHRSHHDWQSRAPMLWGGHAQGPKEIGDIETDDEKDEEAEYEQWKSRELRRIRRARWLHNAVPLSCNRQSDNFIMSDTA